MVNICDRLSEIQHCSHYSRDVNKATQSKAKAINHKAKAADSKAKAMTFKAKARAI